MVRRTTAVPPSSPATRREAQAADLAGLRLYDTSSFGFTLKQRGTRRLLDLTFASSGKHREVLAVGGALGRTELTDLEVRDVMRAVRASGGKGTGKLLARIAQAHPDAAQAKGTTSLASLDARISSLELPREAREQDAIRFPFPGSAPKKYDYDEVPPGAYYSPIDRSWMLDRKPITIAPAQRHIPPHAYYNAADMQWEVKDSRLTRPLFTGSGEYSNSDDREPR